MKDLFQIPSEKASLLQGISPALIARDGTFWRDGRNVEFRDRAVGSQAGSEQLFSIDPIDNLVQTYTGGRRILYVAAESGLYAWENGEQTFMGGDAAASWSLQTYGKLLFASNRRGQTYYWDGEALDPIEELSEQPVKIIAKLAEYLIYLGIGDEGERILWSDQDDPLNLDLLSDTSRAGDLFLRDLGSDIQACAQLGDSLAIYSADRMGVLSQAGGVFVFGFQLLLDGIGAVGPDAVVSVGRQNYGFGREGIWVTDGNQFQYADDPLISRWLQGRVDWVRAEGIYGYHNELAQEIIWSYPVAGVEGNSEAVGFNYQLGTWTLYNRGFSAAAARDVFEWPLEARGSGVFSIGAAKNTEECWIQSAPLDMGQRDYFKRLQAARFGVEGNAELELGVQYSLSDPIEWYWRGPIEPETFLPEREAPYFVLRVSGKDWKISSILLKGVYTGAVI